MHVWDIVPLCERQLRDVRTDDILEDGLYRKCDTYRGGGGYDKFPEISEKFTGKPLHNQFVVQLRGCSLSCPYCYVTPDGIWGEPVLRDSAQLLKAFESSGQEVFHLMGGAPALTAENVYAMKEIVQGIPSGQLFHSDLLLVEHPYQIAAFRQLANTPAIFAVDIKGLTTEEFRVNTGTEWVSELFYSNLDVLLESGINMYFTFTAVDHALAADFMEYLHSRSQGREFYAYHIELILYDALK